MSFKLLISGKILYLNGVIKLLCIGILSAVREGNGGGIQITNL